MIAGDKRRITYLLGGGHATGRAARHEDWQATQARLNDLRAWRRAMAANLDRMSYNEQRLGPATLGVQVKLYRAARRPRFETAGAIPLDACLAVRLEGKEADPWTTPSTSATSA